MAATLARDLDAASTLRWKAYPAYRDSGIEWLGQVPAHWEVNALKWLLARNDSGTWGEDTDDDWGTVVLRSTDMTLDGTWQIVDPARRKVSASEYMATRLRIGDLLVTKSSGSARHIGKTALVTREVEALDCCFSNFMQRLRVRYDCDPTFVYWFLNCVTGRDQLIYLASTTTGLANINGGILGSTVISLPSLPEQQAIAAFLDRETAKIDSLIAKKGRLIALLQEKRVALISHVVTKGLDPNAPMKDSGVEWLGEIPAHWDLLHLGRVASFRPSPSEIRKLDPDDPVSFLPMEAISDDGTFDRSSIRLLREVESGYTYFRDGDVIRAKVTPCFENGKGALMTGLTNGVGFGTTELFVIRPGPRLSGPFLYYLTVSPAFTNIGASTIYGAHGVKRVDDGFVRSFPVALPSFSEQRAIAAFLDHKIAKIDALIAKQDLSLLAEHRAALISAAVTGKIDIREEVA